MTMIAQVLNRQFMLQQLDDIHMQLRDDVAKQRQGGQADPALQTEDYAEALAHIEDAVGKETAASSGQPGFESPPPERRSDWPADLDDFAFISRDPVISAVQSAIEYYFEHPEHADAVARQEPPDDQRRGPADYPVVTDRSLRSTDPMRQPDGRRLFDKFSITDLGWVSSVVAMAMRKVRNRYPFNSNPPPSLKVGNETRIVLVGDWGTGLPRAQKVASGMRKHVEESLGRQQDLHVMHLGDVYYSGWDFEYKNRFFPYWPVWPEEAHKARSWSLNGNHDMYSGGHAYYETLLADPRFAGHGGASFFHLYNDDWQLFGLDTAWDDNGLKDPQADFVNSKLATYKQKAICFSHHQFFSAYEPAPDCGKVLREKLGKALSGNRIFAAFWGHEHRCVLYDSYQNIRYGRLIGHGGVPVYMTHGQRDPYTAPAAYEDRRSIDKGLEHWALFGFAVLDFSGPALRVRYFDEDGGLTKEETINAKAA